MAAGAILPPRFFEHCRRRLFPATAAWRRSW